MNYMEIVSTGILALACIIMALLLSDQKSAILQYAAQLVARGIPADKIRSYGFAFEGKRVLIGD